MLCLSIRCAIHWLGSCTMLTFSVTSSSLWFWFSLEEEELDKYELQRTARMLVIMDFPYSDEGLMQKWPQMITSPVPLAPPDFWSRQHGNHGMDDKKLCPSCSLLLLTSSQNRISTEVRPRPRRVGGEFYWYSHSIPLRHPATALHYHS